MDKTIVHHEEICSLERTGKKVKLTPAVIKIRLDVRARICMLVDGKTVIVLCLPPIDDGSSRYPQA